MSFHHGSDAVLLNCKRSTFNSSPHTVCSVSGGRPASFQGQYSVAAAAEGCFSMYRSKECERALGTPLSTNATEHGCDRRRTPNLDGPENLETMPPIERDVLWARRFQVGWRSVLVTTPESMHQQGRAVPLSLLRRINPDQRQVPVRLIGMILPHLLEHREQGILVLLRDGALKMGHQSPFIGLRAWRPPQRGGLDIVDEPGHRR